MSVTEDRQHLLNQIKGQTNKSNGDILEGFVISANERYKARGEAYIEKTPEPVKVLRPCGNGQFVACYEKKAQPDFKGTLKGGRSVCFECKHTDTGKMLQSAVTEWQEEALDSHSRMGASCFVVVSFGFEKFFRIPLGVWKNMKQIFGRKYILPEDVTQYRIPFKGTFLDYLKVPVQEENNTDYYPPAARLGKES